MKPLLIITLMSTMAISAVHAQTTTVLHVRDTITDNNIIFPESFDTDTKELMSNWYLQRYAVLDSLAKRPVVPTVSDKEYISRLQKLPTVIEMPYNSIVRQYIEMYAQRRQDLVEKMLSLSLYYNPIFEDALERYGLPLELKYLPVIESALNPNAVSKAGAAGLWQFMPSTATGEGLEVNSLIDERRDPIKSSDAAASLLKKYYAIYGNWPLVLAAYNCGPGNVNKAMKNSGGKKDFWEIYTYLPKETRGYVPAFIAATYIMNNFGYHGISPAVARYPIVTDTVHVNNRVHFKQIADVMGLTVDELRVLNPQYRQDVIPGNIKPYALILPSVQAYCYKACEDSILAHDRDLYATRETVEPMSSTVASSSGTDSKGSYVDELVVRYHTVKRGETLKSIAQIYGVTQESIKKANNMSSSKVKRGRKLKINTYKRTYVQQEQAANNNANANAGTGISNPEANTASTDSVATTTQEQQPTEVATVVAPSTQAPAPKPQTKQTQPKTTKYTVKSGDTLNAIATRNGITVAQLKAANGLKSDNIRAGQTLNIPAKASAGAKKSTSGKKSTSSKKKASSKKSKKKK